LRVTESDFDVAFPATSVASTVIVFRPGVRVTEQLNAPLRNAAAIPLHVTAATPDRRSVAVPLNANAEAFTTALLAGELMVRTGGVLSRLMVALALLLLPATSVAVPAITCPAPSVVTTCGPGQVAIPEMLSEH
jgi:hypothetical protein